MAILFSSTISETKKKINVGLAERKQSSVGRKPSLSSWCLLLEPGWRTTPEPQGLQDASLRSSVQVAVPAEEVVEDAQRGLQVAVHDV